MSSDDQFTKPTSSTWPVCEADEQEAALRVLRSGKLNYWTGNECKQFEQEFGDYIGRTHAIAVSNGTAALELALFALGIGPGDEVIVPSRTFIATASSVALSGATPVCADVDPDSQNLTAESIRERISTKTRAVIPVHLAGWPCEMDEILELAKRHQLRVIEDCAQAHGAQYRGRRAGSFGDAAAFSFCQDKIVTTAGEGGMLLLRDEDAWRRAWSRKDHGKDLSLVEQPSSQPGFRWLHQRFGTNLRMTEVQAAVGRIALRKLDHWLDQRRSNAHVLNDRLKDCPGLRLTIPPDHIRHAYYKWYAFVSPDELGEGWNRDRVIHEMNQRGVKCFSGSCGEIYREGAFDGVHPAGVRLPVAKRLGETSLMLQVDPTLAEEDLRRASTILRSYMAEACKGIGCPAEAA